MNFKKLPTYLQAVMLFMLLSAILHLGVLAVYFFTTHDSVPLNFFSIIGLDLFSSSFVTSPLAPLYSSVTTLLLYCGIFYYVHHENRRTR
jgi:hypothetical protein